MLTRAGLLPGVGFTCDPTIRPLPSDGGLSAGLEGGKLCRGRGRLATSSLPSMDHRKLTANSGMQIVL